MPSVEASSTTIHRAGGSSCAASALTTRSMWAPSLRTGETMRTRGSTTALRNRSEYHGPIRGARVDHAETLDAKTGFLLAKHAARLGLSMFGQARPFYELSTARTAARGSHLADDFKHSRNQTLARPRFLRLVYGAVSLALVAVLGRCLLGKPVVGGAAPSGVQGSAQPSRPLL